MIDAITSNNFQLKENKKDFVEKVLYEAKVPVIIDADGLNAISKNPDVLRKTSKTLIFSLNPLKTIINITNGIAIIEI